MPENGWVNRRLVAVVVLSILALVGVGGVLVYRNAHAERIPAVYRPMVISAAATCPGLSASILAAQIAQESNWRPDVTSSAGAQGIAQFVPRTWAAYGVDGDHDGRISVFDPADAIPSAANYDCVLLKETASVPGDHVANMLAAYNAGPGAVRHNGGVPPFHETQNYVKAILARSLRAPYVALG
jgi:soluble lytic murein transglycosylase-like protein